MTEENTASFVKGARVMYGSHGVCLIERVVTEQVLGQEIPMVHIRTGTGNTIRVAEHVAKRDFVSVDTVSQLVEVLAILGKPRKATPPNWLHTEKKYAKLLGTNDAVLLATLVRDLHPGDKPRDTELAQLYRTGLFQLVQSLEISEERDVSSILKQLSEASGLLLLEEDAKPTVYVARSRSKQVKPSTSVEKAMMMVKMPRVRPVAALPRPAPAPKQAVEKLVVPQALSAAKPVVKPVATTVFPEPVAVVEPAQEKLPFVPPVVTPPVQPKLATPSQPVVVAPPKAEPEPGAVVPPSVKRVAPSVKSPPADDVVSTLRLENQLLRQQLSTLEGEKKALKSVADRVLNLETRLQAAQETNQSLRNQLSSKDSNVAEGNRRRQQIEREQRDRETYQIERIKQLGELLGVLFVTGQLLAAALREKMTAPPIVQAKVGRSDRVTEGDDAKENLRHARRTNTLRKRRIEALEATVKSLERELREMNATLVQQEERLATNGVDNLLEVLVTRKQEIDALSALLGEKTKEVNRLNTLVQRRDETIRSLRVKVLTDKQLQDKIEAVRVDLFQYIFERTQAVERLQAYNREREERNK